MIYFLSFVQGECLLTVQLCDEECVEDEEDVEFYLLFAGSTQRHVSSTLKVSHVTLQAVCPGQYLKLQRSHNTFHIFYQCLIIVSFFLEPDAHYLRRLTHLHSSHAGPGPGIAWHVVALPNYSPAILFVLLQGNLYISALSTCLS